MRVRSRPIRVASVRLPAARSVAMSRRLLRTRIAVARKPIAHDISKVIGSGVMRAVSTK